MAQPSDPDWNPDEVTQHGARSPAVQDLYDPDLHAMVGKIARATADTQAQVRELAKNWKAERAARKRARRTEAFTLASVVGLIQAIVIGLREAGFFR